MSLVAREENITFSNLPVLHFIIIAPLLSSVKISYKKNRAISWCGENAGAKEMWDRVWLRTERDKDWGIRNKVRWVYY